MPAFTLDLGGAKRPLQKYWEMCVGSCHATTALREDWRQMLRQCQRELGFRYIRFHGLFDDDMSVVRQPMGVGPVQLSFLNIDRIFDFLLSIGMKPFIELGFMPECLASGTKTIFHYKGNTTPPKDHAMWAWFIGEFVKHLIARYGRAEVRTWFFEVWNEPNLGGPDSPFGFWAGTMADYFKLYKVTAEAIKREDAFLRVGGPATSNNAWIPEMIAFCRNSGAPVDFISTHHYPTDVVLGFGVEDSANFVKPPIDMNDPKAIAKLMADPKALAEAMAQYSVFKETLWTHVDRGVLKDMTERVVREAEGLPVYYTEWSSLAGLPSDGPFGASFIAKTVLDGRGLVEAYSYWTFCDIFEESGQDSRAFFGGFGLMTSHGIPKAPYRAYEMLHTLGDAIYDAPMAEGTVDVYAVEKPESGALQLLIANHHSLLHPIAEEAVTVRLEGFGSLLDADIQRIDETHANALAAWEKMGSPVYLTDAQVMTLQGASAMAREPFAAKAEGGNVEITVAVPPMGIALVTLYRKG